LGDRIFELVHVPLVTGANSNEATCQCAYCLHVKIEQLREGDDDGLVSKCQKVNDTDFLEDHNDQEAKNRRDKLPDVRPALAPLKSKILS
jgi:hypothetical protein